MLCFLNALGGEPPNDPAEFTRELDCLGSNTIKSVQDLESLGLG